MPLILATGSALEQWRRLLDDGIGHGALENRVAEMLPPPGTSNAEAASMVRAGSKGGLVFGDGWLARFDRLDRSPGGARRTVWRIISVERRRG